MQIRPYQPNDLPAVLAFLRRHFPQFPAKCDPRYFAWRFEQNPLGSALDQYWLAWEGDELIGQMGSIRDRVWANGAWHEARWLVDLLVAPEHRGGLAALRLFQAHQAKGDLLLAVGAGPHLLRLYEALGWDRLEIAKAMYLPIQPSRLRKMARAAEEGVATRWSIADLLWRGADWLAPLPIRLVNPKKNPYDKSPTIHVEAASSPAIFDEVAALAEELRPDQGCTTSRDAAVLRWKLAECPVGARRLWAARDANGKLRGYLAAKVLRRAGMARWGEVIDYLAPTQEMEVFLALATQAARWGLDEKLDFVRWRLSLTFHSGLLKCRFWRERTRPVTDEIFIHTADEDLAAAFFSPPGQFASDEDRVAAVVAWPPGHFTSFVSDRADYGGDDDPADSAP